ncbi:MAG: hypothetical protein JKY95_02865 [Planctomycetaceae bacterium]|nr:hypothetical protein [Planctomycetaceae bacterium]
MSNHDSTTIVDSVASPATPRPVRKNRRRKNVVREAAGGAQSYSNGSSKPARVKPSLKDGVSIGSLFLLVRYWVRTAVATGFGVSLLIHVTALVVMSLVMLDQFKSDDSILTSISTAEESSVFDEIIDVRMDVPMGDISLEKSLESAMDMEVADWADSPVTTGIEESVESLFEKDGLQGLGGAGFLAPKDARVFTKGSFSAWTVPNDPDPGENYVIVIVVKLPSRVKRYRASDLSGMVVGTDGYRLAIPGPAYTRGKVYLPIKNRMVQMKVTVQGGASRVRDVINIRSTSLKEKQRIELEF